MYDNNKITHKNYYKKFSDACKKVLKELIFKSFETMVIFKIIF